MATYKIISENKPYYSLEILFGEYVFPQTVISSLTGQALNNFLQKYSDMYEADYLQLMTEP